MEPDQFCWRAGALLTLLTLNPRNSGSGYQLMIPKISYLTIVNESRISKIDKLPTFINENKLYRLKYMVMKGRTLSPYGYSYHYIPQSVPLSFNTGNTLRFVQLNNSSFKIRNNKTSLSALIKITLQYLSFS